MKHASIRDTHRNRTYLALVSPALAVFCVIFVLPFLYSLLISMSDGKQIIDGKTDWVGLKNYGAVLSSSSFWVSLGHTLAFVAITIALELALGMIIALLLNRNLPGTRLFRLVYSLPLMIAPVVAGLQWRWLFADQYGVINAILGLFGCEAPLWFSRPLTAWTTILAANLWLATPFVVLVLVSGLSSLSSDLNEAAEVDGAGKGRIFFHVTLPQLKPAILIILVIRVTDAFRVYDLVYILTGGGPGGATEVLSTSIYKQIFVFLEFGQGAAASLLVTAIIFALSLVLNKLLAYTGD